MTRLTKEIKEKICKNAIEQSPATKELEGVNEELSELALDVYNDNVTKKESEEFFEITERIKKLPFDGGYFYERAHIRCNFGGMYCSLPVPEHLVFFEFKEMPTYPAEHEFAKKFMLLDCLMLFVKNEIKKQEEILLKLQNQLEKDNGK